MKHSIVSLLFSAFLLLVIAEPAQALKLKGLDIDQVVRNDEYPAIRVKFNRETDNWTDVSSAMVEVKIDWQVDVEAAYALAPPSNISINLDNMSNQEELRSTNNHLTERHTNVMTLRRAGNELVDIKAKALEICATIRGNRGKPNKEHRIVRLFPAHAHVEAYTTATWFTEEMARKTKLMRVDVICEKDPDWREPIEPAVKDVTADLGDFRVIKTELFLTTFQNQFTEPNPGTKCKKVQVKLRIETNKPGQLSYTLWRQPGDKIQKTVFIPRLTEGPFKGRSVHEQTLVDTFDKTTYQQYMLEAGGFPMGESTPWKDIHIICTGPGPGGLAGEAPGGGAGNELPTFAVIDSNVMLQRLPGNQCPARVKVIVTHRTNMPGAFEQYVGCSNGFSNRDRLAARDAISDTNFGVRREYLVEMQQGGELTCSARAVDFPRELALRKLAVQCHGGPQDKVRAPAAPPPPPPPLRKKRE